MKISTKFLFSSVLLFNYISKTNQRDLINQFWLGTGDGWRIMNAMASNIILKILCILTKDESEKIVNTGS